MKHPLLTDTRSSYFSASHASENTQVRSNDESSTNLRFPNSRVDLWNTMSCGESIGFGIQHYHPVTLLCLERCLRLAHRHASQLLRETESRKNHQFHGFLMGSTAYTDDESGIVLNLDRFDPGTVRTDGNITPSTPLPGDIVVPVAFKRGLQHTGDMFNVFSVQDFQNTFKLLLHQVSSHLPVENTSLLPIRLYCCYDKDPGCHVDVQLQLHWVTPCISNSMHATPIKPVPVIPTALAKNLSGPLNLSQIQNSSKTGYLSMNQSRKLLLLLDSDPKSRSLPTVGIWVSGVISVHNPIVWLACMRYLYCQDIYERIMTNDQMFLLVLYSITSRTPLFYQVKSDDCEKLNFDLLHTQKCIQVCQQTGGESEKIVEFRLQSASSSVPEVIFKEREIFLEALEKTESFLAPKKIPKQEDEDSSDDEEPPQPRGRLQKKNTAAPQSILRKNSTGRKSSGNRNSTNGVSFSLAVDNFNGMEAAPLPLPSPHPSATYQSPGLIKPTVPELSIIFDENYQVPQRQNYPNKRPQSKSPVKRRSMSEKVQTNSPGIRSPLKNINNLNPNNRGPQERKQGPMKPTSYRPPLSRNGYLPNGTHFNPISNQAKARPPNMGFPQRRSQSASDTLRAPTGQIHSMQQLGPTPRPIMSYPAMYSSTPIVPNSHPNVPMTSQGPIQPRPYPLGYPPQSRPPVSYPYTQQHSEPHYTPNYVSTTAPGYPVPYPQVISDPLTTPFPQQTPNFYQNKAAKPITTSHSMGTANLLNTPNFTPQNTQYIPPASISNKQEDCQHLIPSISKEDGIPQNPLPIESPAWMKQLPPEAYQLLMHQDAQLKQLQAQIQKLLSIQEKNQTPKQDTVTTETSTSTDPVTKEGKILRISMGVNTGTSLCFPTVETGKKKREIESESYVSSNDTTPVSTPSNRPAILDTPGNFDQTSSTKLQESHASPRIHIATPNQLNNLRCESQCTERYQASEFASILLDDSNLREIATANIEDDADVRSLASSLRAVDLPVLETSTEQSSINTPTRKMSSDMWNAQDSPILGESASMCFVPPINLNRSLLEAANEEDARSLEEQGGDPKDETFMKNLLGQVRDMLQKADNDGTSEISSENSVASTPQRNDEKTKKSRHSHEDRVAKATRKQLRKMGVKLGDEVVNALSSAVYAEGGREFTSTLPEPLIPRLNYLSIMAGASRDNSIYPGPSSTELSMHANAIALKYLSNDQLEEIAALSKLGQNTSLLYSPLKPKAKSKSKSSSSTSGGDKSNNDMLFGLGIRTEERKQLPGMSLVSPCNMSLATRKYMEKYGLIDNDEEESDEEEEEEKEWESEKQEHDFLRNQRPETPVNEVKKLTSASDSPVLKGIRQNRDVSGQNYEKIKENFPAGAQNGGYPNFPGEEPGFSDLKMNLGDTLDMILPFLDDLGRHRQQTPSPGTNGRDSRSGTRSTRTSSSKERIGSVSDRPLSRNEQCHDEELPPSKKLQHLKQKRRSEKEEDISQILSPKLLQALAEGKKLGPTPASSARTGYFTPHSHRESYKEDYQDEEDEDDLAGTWPQHQFRSRSESSQRNNEESSREHPNPGCRRQSSSPNFPGDSSSARRNRHEYRKQRTSPPSSSKLRRIRAIHERSCTNTLEDVKEVEWNQTEQDYKKETYEEEEPVLTSRVTDAFREKEETTRQRSKEKSERENSPHFLQHLQEKSSGNQDERFLDMDKIKNLPKLG